MIAYVKGRTAAGLAATRTRTSSNSMQQQKDLGARTCSLSVPAHHHMCDITDTLQQCVCSLSCSVTFQRHACWTKTPLINLHAVACIQGRRSQVTADHPPHLCIGSLGLFRASFQPHLQPTHKCSISGAAAAATAKSHFAATQCQAVCTVPVAATAAGCLLEAAVRLEFHVKVVVGVNTLTRSRHCLQN
jgi:hypothetical protein